MHDVTCVLETARSRAARATLMQTQLTRRQGGRKVATLGRYYRVHARRSEGDKGSSMATSKVSLLGLLAKILSDCKSGISASAAFCARGRVYKGHGATCFLNELVRSVTVTVHLWKRGRSPKSTSR